MIETIVDRAKFMQVMHSTSGVKKKVQFHGISEILINDFFDKEGNLIGRATQNWHTNQVYEYKLFEKKTVPGICMTVSYKRNATKPIAHYSNFSVATTPCEIPID